MFEQPKTKIQIGALFGCISDSIQPLAVHSHQLLCVQPNDSGKHNTAKSCTEYSQYICSVWDFDYKWLLNKPYVNEATLSWQKTPIKCFYPLELLKLF